MRLSAPKQLTWIIALILTVLGLIGAIANITFLSDYAFWFAFVAAVLLLLATWIKDL